MSELIFIKGSLRPSPSDETRRAGQNFRGFVNPDHVVLATQDSLTTGAYSVELHLSNGTKLVIENTTISAHDMATKGMPEPQTDDEILAASPPQDRNR